MRPGFIHARFPARWRWAGMLMLLNGLAGCHAQRPDMSAEAAALTGLDHAIEFREQPEAMDSDAPAGPSLTPVQAVRRALLHDPRIQMSLAKVRIAEADANQARLLPNPILTLDLRFPLAGGSNTAFEPSLAMDLIALLQKPAMTSAADQRLREAAANAMTTVLDVISEVQETYCTAKMLDDQTAAADERLKILQHLRELADKRLNAGDATRLDVLSIDAQVGQAKLDLNDLHIQRDEQRLHLARMFNQPRSPAEWELAAPQTPAARDLEPEPAWIEAALKNRPEIMSRIWELRALGYDLQLTNLLPLQGSDLGVHGEHDPVWRVGPVWNTPVPIFDWGQAAREKVKAQAASASHDLAEQELEVVESIRVAHGRYRRSRQTLTLAEDEILPLQLKQLEQARLAYQSGDADITTLLLAENELSVTRAKIVELQEKTALARIKLERAAGGAGVAPRSDNAATESTTHPTTTPATTGETR